MFVAGLLPVSATCELAATKFRRHRQKRTKIQDPVKVCGLRACDSMDEWTGSLRIPSLYFSEIHGRKFRSSSHRAQECG